MTNVVHLSNLRALPDMAEPFGMACFSDAFPQCAEDAGLAGLLLSQLKVKPYPILWVRDRMSGLEAGDIYLAQRISAGFVHVSLNRPIDVLQAMEDGLASGALGGIIGELWGEPQGLTFTATKRLAMRAEANKLPCWLIRHNAHPNLSAARNRWRVASLPSSLNPDDPKAPGDPRWRVELFRSRSHAPGTWVARYDRAQDRLDFAAFPADGTVDQNDGTRGHPTAAGRADRAGD